jgi:hypothetical protein
MKLYIILFLISISFVSVGQEAKFVWNGEMCKFESTYDSNIYTKDEVKNAYNISNRDFYSISYTAVLNIYHLKFISLEKLDTEYKTKKHKIDSIQLPKLPIYEDYRKSILKEIKQSYSKARIIYESFINNDPSVFEKYFASDSCMVQHANALVAGGEELLDNWDKMIKANYDNYSQSAKDRHERRHKSPDKLLYAQILVTSLGWGNCANKYVDYFENHEAFKEFEKLLIDSKELICDGD